MLSRNEALCDYEVRNRTVRPHRLGQRDHGHYVGYAERMLDIYGQGVGRRRCDLHRDVEAVFDQEECHPRCIKAFQKLLDEVSQFEAGREGTRELRRAVFGRAAESHPLVREGPRFYGHDENEVKASITRELKRPWGEIEEDLFSDLHDFRRLKRFDGYANAAALLARYNVAQVQAALYDAVEMRVWTGERTDLKILVRQVKWAELVHEVSRRSDGKAGYKFVFDGPASVHEHTRRYGANMAQFIPALLLCEDWSMEAFVQRPGDGGARFRLLLDSKKGLHGHMTPSKEFDSGVEETFFKKWGGEESVHEGWRMRREGTVLERHQHLFTPDFTLVHVESGREVLFEIVGYWRDAYRQHKLDTLERFGKENVIWAVRAGLYEEFRGRGAVCFSFKNAVKLKPLLECLRGLNNGGGDGSGLATAGSPKLP